MVRAFLTARPGLAHADHHRGRHRLRHRRTVLDLILFLLSGTARVVADAVGDRARLRFFRLRTGFGEALTLGKDFVVP